MQTPATIEEVPIMFFAALAFLPQLATGAGWVKVAKFLFTPRNLIRFAGVLAVTFVLHMGYNWIIERGMAKQAKIDAPIIQTLTTERNQARTELHTLKDSVKTWKQQSVNAQKLFASQQKTLIDDLNAKLKLAQQKGQHKKKELTRDLPKYIPAAVDAFLPVGFLRLYNRSLEGENSGVEDGVSGSFQGTAGATSGTTLSTFARNVLLFNNNEAVQRGLIIKGWQDWYATTKANFTEAQRKAAEAIPKDPSTEPTPQPTSTPANAPATTTGPAVLVSDPPVPPDDSI